MLPSRGIPAFAAWAEGLAAPRRVFFNMEVDRFVMVFAAVVASGSALVFGLVLALRSSRVDLVSVINEDASPRGAARGRLRTGLVVAPLADQDDFAERVAAAANPIDDVRGTAAYRRHALRVLTSRALERCSVA